MQSHKEPKARAATSVENPIFLSQRDPLLIATSDHKPGFGRILEC